MTTTQKRLVGLLIFGIGAVVAILAYCEEAQLVGAFGFVIAVWGLSKSLFPG